MTSNYTTLIIYYFTGTGNARKASEWMIQKAAQLGYTTYLVSIARFETIEIPEFKGKALIGFASPTHGFNMAPIMLKFIHKFPKRLNADVFVLNTRAGTKLYKWFLPGASGIALLYTSLVLRLKSYRVRGLVPIDLPSNWFMLHPGIRTPVVESMNVHYKNKCEQQIAKMLDGRYVGQAWRDFPFDIALLPIAILYYGAGRFALAKTYFADHTCSHCGKCAKNCPVAAIEMKNGLPFWKINCESCMRCVNICPENAIQTNHFIVLIVWGMVYYLCYIATKQIDIFFNLNPYGFLGIFILLINSIIFGFLAIPMFNLLFKLSTYKSVRKVFALTSLTYYPFWRRYKYNLNRRNDNK